LAPIVFGLESLGGRLMVAGWFWARARALLIVRSTSNKRSFSHNTRAIIHQRPAPLEALHEIN
jgi:hypothetical protein